VSHAYFTGARCMVCGEWRSIAGRSPVIEAVCPTCTARSAHRVPYAVPPATIADGPEPDPSEPVAPDPRVELMQSYRDDLDVMGHA